MVGALGRRTIGFNELGEPINKLFERYAQKLSHYAWDFFVQTGTASDLNYARSIIRRIDWENRNTQIAVSA